MNLIRKYKITKLLNNQSTLSTMEKELIDYAIKFTDYICKQKLNDDNEIFYKIKRMDYFEGVIALRVDDFEIAYNTFVVQHDLNILISYLLKTKFNCNRLEARIKEKKELSPPTNEYSVTEYYYSIKIS